MSGELRQVQRQDDESKRRPDVSTSHAAQAAVLSASLGIVVGILIELALPGHGPRIGLSIAGLVAGAFAFAWSVRALTVGGGR
jgi:hypothetical protein